MTLLNSGHLNTRLSQAEEKKPPVYNMLLRRIKEIWVEIPREIVQNSLRVCGLSNALNGTEDEALCAEGMDSILEAQCYKADDDIELLLWRN